MSAAPLRIVVHDYAGHPFPVQLSRELAHRGHTVLHLHCPSYRTGKGALTVRADDPARFSCEGIELRRPLQKYSLWRRPLQELEYVRPLVRRVRRFQPDRVVSGNTPLVVQTVFLAACRRIRVPFLFWQQDMHGLAMRQILRERLPLRGAGLAELFPRLERGLLRRSDAVVTIAADFVSVLEAWGVERDRVSVVENWAPLDELPERRKENGWAQEHGLVGKRVFLYSGTLGLKHDPGVLLQLALRFRSRSDVRVVVVSEGDAADGLRAQAAAHGLESLLVVGFQPYERLPDVHASADVLLVLLEPGLSAFSVPSKVLTYHCAGRPLLAAMPHENLAARVVERSGAGIVVEPGNHEAFLASAERLLADGPLRERLGRNARAYAERTFDVVAVADRFERVLEGLVARPRGRRLMRSVEA